MYILYNEKMCHCFTCTFHEIGDFVRKFADILQSAQFQTVFTKILPQITTILKEGREQHMCQSSTKEKTRFFYSKASQDQLWKAGDLRNFPIWHQSKLRDNYCSNHYFSLPISFTINVPCNSKICVPFPCHLLKRGKRADSPGLEISSLSSD